MWSSMGATITRSHGRERCQYTTREWLQSRRADAYRTARAADRSVGRAADPRCGLGCAQRREPKRELAGSVRDSAPRRAGLSDGVLDPRLAGTGAARAAGAVADRQLPRRRDG